MAKGTLQRQSSHLCPHLLVIGDTSGKTFVGHSVALKRMPEGAATETTAIAVGETVETATVETATAGIVTVGNVGIVTVGIATVVADHAAVGKTGTDVTTVAWCDCCLVSEAVKRLGPRRAMSLGVQDGCFPSQLHLKTECPT